ncbi:MAG: type II secretion system F family protein [Kiloniellales bacterium]
MTQILAALGLTPNMAIALALPLVAGLMLLFAAFAGGKDQERFKRRLHKVRNHATKMRGPLDDRVNVRLSTSDSQFALLDRLIKQALPRRTELRFRLDRAGLKITLGTYITISLVVAIVCFTGLMLTGMLPPAVSVLCGIAAGIALPHVTVGLLAQRRQAKFLANFPEAIDLMTRGLKSGLPIMESIKTAGQEVPNPVGSELRHVTDAVRLGHKLEDVLDETGIRLGLQEFKFFTISLAIQSETGGNLAETLSNLSDVLRKRRQLKLKIKALSGEAKASAYIIGSLPFVMAALIYMINPGYISALYTDARGHIMVGLGLFSFFVGAAVMFKMVRFDY